MELKNAQEVAAKLIGYLRPGCKRIAIAGSVRRLKAEPKDIEIVFIPRFVSCQVDLFTVAPVPATDRIIDDLVATGILAWDLNVKRNGPKYKRLVHLDSGAVIELFIAQPLNWGLILALRTGPAAFMKVLVTHDYQDGAMAADMKMKDGFLWRRGKQLATLTEEDFFHEVGIPCWKPEERTTARLWEYLRGRQDLHRLTAQIEAWEPATAEGALAKAGWLRGELDNAQVCAAMAQ